MSEKREFFINGNTFAAPFVSERVQRYREADSAEAALAALAAEMEGGIGLYSAMAYAGADDFHKGRKPLARWLSNHAAATEGAGSVMSHGPGRLEVDGAAVKVDNPKAGSVV